MVARETAKNLVCSLFVLVGIADFAGTLHQFYTFFNIFQMNCEINLVAGL